MRLLKLKLGGMSPEQVFSDLFEKLQTNISEMKGPVTQLVNLTWNIFLVVQRQVKKTIQIRSQIYQHSYSEHPIHRVSGL
jgi:hypothetical protein